MKLRWVLLSTAAIAAQATAQDVAGDPDQAGAASEEIVVTGQFQNSLVNRLPIDLVELPFALDVIDRELIEERGFLRPLEVLTTLPNVFQRNTQFVPGGETYLVRGLIATALTNNRPESLSRGAGRREDSFIERVELARGPASIILGPVIPGGVINQVTKSPQKDDFLDVEVRGGSFDTYRGELDANVRSLFGIDAVRARMTLAYQNSGTAQRFSENEVFAVRPVVEFDFSSRTRAQASIAYKRSEVVPDSKFAIFSDGTVPERITPKTFFGLPASAEGDDLYFDGEFQHEFLDNLKLTLRGSYQDTDFEYRNSQGLYSYAGPGLLLSDPIGYVYSSVGSFDEKVTYADAQLSGNFGLFGQRQDWVVGATYQRTQTNSTFGFDKVIGPVDVRNPDATVYDTPDFTIPSPPFFIFDDKLKSVYAEANIRPADALTIVAGIRYDSLEQININPLNPGGNDDVTYKPDDVTFRVGASLELRPGLNAYASYAQSFIPQGGQTRQGMRVAPETAENYEVGLKGRLFGAMNITAAAFHLTRQNVATRDPANVFGESFVVAVGEQRHQGFEVALDGDILPNLNVALSYGYVDAEITRDNDAAQQGTRVRLVPHSTLSLFGTYKATEGALAGLRIGGGMRHISKRPGDLGLGLTYSGYTLVDAIVAYEIRPKTEIQLNIINLLDKRYLEQTGFSAGGPNGGFLFGSPRAAYVTLRSRF